MESMTANLNSARCAQLRIGRLHRETSSILGALDIILDEVNLLVKLAEGEVPMKYCRDCSRNDKPSCTECFSGLQMSRYKKVK